MHSDLIVYLGLIGIMTLIFGCFVITLRTIIQLIITLINFILFIKSLYQFSIEETTERKTQIDTKITEKRIKKRNKFKFPNIKPNLPIS